MSHATSIMLASGNLFDLASPETSLFRLTDIAAGLSKVARFAGQTSRFYSVAEHSVHVARLVLPELSRAALLHDASEAFIGDMTRPAKSLLPDYRALEARIMAAIIHRLAAEFPGTCLDVAAPCIKKADTDMAAHESRDMMPHAPGYWFTPDVGPAFPVRLQYRMPDGAAAMWLEAWHKYGHMSDGVAG